MMKPMHLEKTDMSKMTAIVVLALLALPAWSQAPASPAKSAQAKAKPVAAKTVKTAKAVKATKPQLAKTPVAPVAEPEAQMGPDELAIAERVHKGQLPCELGASVRLEADATQPGYFYLHGKGFRYRMHPVATSTGAIRLEDRKAGAVWLQLANKSMLMDQNKGRRLADECVNAEQVAFAENMKTNPPPSLIDTTGMGR
jgi:type IV secretory pathway VirB10-like protein